MINSSDIDAYTKVLTATSIPMSIAAILGLVLHWCSLINLGNITKGLYDVLIWFAVYQALSLPYWLWTRLCKTSN